MVTTKFGQRRKYKTTSGWNLLVRWRDGREQWVPLRILKECNPIEVAEFAFSRNLEEEAAFSWWVDYTMKKRDAIITSVTSRISHSTHKYGIEIPQSIEEAKRIDIKNGNRMWQDAIDKEMTNVAVAFEILPKGQLPPPG